MAFSASYAALPETYRRERFVMVVVCFVSALFVAFILNLWDVDTSVTVAVCSLLVVSGLVMVVAIWLDGRDAVDRALATDQIFRVLINVAQIALIVSLYNKLDIADVREFLLALNLGATFASAVHAVVFPRTRLVVLAAAFVTSTIFTITLVLHENYLLAAAAATYCAASTAVSIFLNRERVKIIELRYQAEEAVFRDTVTDLLNRLGLQNRLLSQPGEAAPPSTLVLIDLDRFKLINDSFGHRVGDEVLRSTAKRLRDALPERTALARIDGDEFAFVLPWPTQSRQTQQTVAGVMQSLALPYPIARQGIRMSVSVGLAALDSPTQLESALREADTAVQDSKRIGGDAVSVFNGLRHLGDMRRGAVEQRFRNALMNDEIDFWVQPIFMLDTLIPSAVEVLARWPNGVGASVTPSQFVELASQTGLILDLGHRALRQAGSILREWDPVPELRRIGVNVNVAPIHLEQGLIDDVMQQIGPELMHRLNIELVEGDSKKVGTGDVASMETLLRSGVGITLDDFGTGNASMTHLRLFPFTGLKIDRSFVHQLDQSYVNRGLVTSIIQMARALDLRVALEGISSQAEFEVARELGPDSGQGYWLMPPMPPVLVREALATYLQNIEGVSHTLGERLQVLHSSWYDRYQTIALSIREPEVTRVIDDVGLAYQQNLGDADRALGATGGRRGFDAGHGELGSASTPGAERLSTP